MVKKGILLVLSGPSGAGKGTVCQALIQDNSSIHLSISVTTRAPRPGEQHGKNYFFISREEFEQMVAQDQLLEWAKVYDNYYGTPRRWVEEKLVQGEDVLLEIDIQGALQIKKKYPDCILVFIVPPSINELQARLISRGTDCDDVIKRRLSCVEGELQEIPKYDFIVVNDKLEEAVNEVKAIITAEKCRPKYFDLQKYLQWGGLS
ncbi:guanylate kinase [Desulfohalotomaculum tongense]|uniref:guanylate kinase n=1 Tax=Desulforadius tongensis TaxID=1216062 RepID=UPI00195D6130|nr:guanylate kinase [Desulforadius tongensis]MBM7855735.1 guanylate kinase [Desulforadius tongensis]